MARYHHQDRPSRRPSDRLRRPVLVLGGLFVALQAVLAVVISVRARYALRRAEARRPPTYPSRTFDAVKLEHRDDEVQLYMRGDELLEAMVEAIDAASEQVLFETFIICDDPSGRTIRDAFDRAAARGVQVLVLWDWLLSDRSVEDGFFGRGVEAYPFKKLRPGPGALRPHNLLRDHRKILVIDRQRAFVGGYNIGDDYLAWRDTHARIDGAAAREVANSFVDFWHAHVPADATRLDDVAGRPWDPHVLVHRNDPSLAIFPIRGMYLEVIDRAEDRIWLTNAYFVPDRAFRVALCRAAHRGVDVRVLLPARSNHPLTDVLAHGMFDELLEAGVRVYLYRDFMLHAKSAVVDSGWVTVGTANIDRWSMLGNYEVNLEVRSKALADQVAEMFELDLSQCDEVDLAAWRHRPWTWRASERVLSSLAPLM